jgi:hypothetical protein
VTELKMVSAISVELTQEQWERTISALAFFRGVQREKIQRSEAGFPYERKNGAFQERDLVECQRLIDDYSQAIESIKEALYG